MYPSIWRVLAPLPAPSRETAGTLPLGRADLAAIWRRRIGAALLLLMAGLVSTPVLAGSCNFEGSDTHLTLKATINIPHDGDWDAADLKGGNGEMTIRYHCRKGLFESMPMPYVLFEGKNADESSGSVIEDTGVKGIAIKFTPTDKDMRYERQQSYPAFRLRRPRNRGHQRTRSFQYTLIKHEYDGKFNVPTSSSKVNSMVLKFGYRQHKRWNWVRPIVTMTTSVKVNLISCTLSGTSTVTLPALSKAVFTGLHNTVGRREFKLLIKCPPIIKQMYYTLSGTRVYEGADGVLISPNDGAYAAGIGVQLLDANANPLKLDNKYHAPPGDLTFSAQYFQTENSISAGKVAATAILTMTYR